LVGWWPKHAVRDCAVSIARRHIVCVSLMRFHLKFETPYRHMAGEDYAMADDKGRAKDAINEGSARAEKAAEGVAEKAGEVMGGVRGYAERVAGQSGEGYREVAERTREGIRRAGAAVRENPGPSVAMAFGVGIAVGAIIGLSLRSGRA
jgi:ElaB/YqjD/DUF883 family membrane-anchored ribosome-binding protein